MVEKISASYFTYLPENAREVSGACAITVPLVALGPYLPLFFGTEPHRDIQQTCKEDEGFRPDPHSRYSVLPGVASRMCEAHHIQRYLRSALAAVSFRISVGQTEGDSAYSHDGDIHRPEGRGGSGAAKLEGFNVEDAGSARRLIGPASSLNLVIGEVMETLRPLLEDRQIAQCQEELRQLFIRPWSLARRSSGIELRFKSHEIHPWRTRSAGSNALRARLRTAGTSSSL